MPILCEVKLRKDQCAFYALIQLLTQATYACSPSQRERLVLFGSRPGFVLQETAHGSRGKIDLYVMLVEPPDGSPHAAICSAAIELGARLLKDERVAARIRRLAWLKGQSDGNAGLTFEALTA
jgi:hypothetical protein